MNAIRRQVHARSGMLFADLVIIGFSHRFYPIGLTHVGFIP
jgi:hypothetical protein